MADTAHVIVMQMHVVSILLVRVIGVHHATELIAVVFTFVVHFNVLRKQLVKCCKLDWVETLLAE